MVPLAVFAVVRLDGAQLRRLKLPEDLLIAVIERDGNASVPHGSHRILAGDILTVVAGPHCAETELAGFLESAKI